MFSPTDDFSFPFSTGEFETSFLRMSTSRPESGDAPVDNSLNTPVEGVAGPAPKDRERAASKGDDADDDGEWTAVPPCDRCAREEVVCRMPPLRQSKLTKCRNCRELSSKGRCSLSGEFETAWLI